MRSVWLATLLAAGCGDTEATPHEEYDELAALTTVECGTYEYNYPPDSDDEFPRHLCGEQPDLGCLTGAIGGPEVVHLERAYYEEEPVGILGELVRVRREHHYFATEDKLVWIAYYQIAVDDPAWYRRYCTTMEARPYELPGQTCWQFVHDNCEFRK